MASNVTVANAVRGWKATYAAALYSSAAALVVSGDSGIIAVPQVVSGGDAVFPLFFTAVGTEMATDETNAIKIDWYLDAAGAAGIIGTTTFDTLTAGAPTDIEAWPGDVTAYNAGRDLVPLMPFMKVTWTLAGTTKSMAFSIGVSYLKMGP